MRGVEVAAEGHEPGEDGPGVPQAVHAGRRSPAHVAAAAVSEARSMDTAHSYGVL